ncbi:diaminopimelate decarboxylase [Nonomuraea sp. NPDC055795]
MCALGQDLAATTETRTPWPSTTLFREDGDATTAGVSLMEIARLYGTPAYVVDEADVRRRCREYADALPGGTVAYAAKAFLCRAMAGWVREEGLSLDVCSGGELAIARSVGFPAERVIFHGNAKTPRELRDAVEAGVGRLVIDNLAEVHRVAALVPEGRRQKILIRVVPDTGDAVPSQKFGLSIATGEAGVAVARVLGQPELELVGLHCHLGSQIDTARPYEEAVRALVEQLALIRDAHGVVLPELDLGGGQAIAYLDSERGLDPRSFAAALTAALEERCAGLGLPVPRLIVEPGRSISGPAGMTLYRVIAVKRGGGRVFVAVDGGMSDNPRPSLYGARYTIKMVGRRSREAARPATVVGHHCETGDVLAENVPLPADVRPGDLLAVAATGAYHHSMASTYNATGRLPVIAVSARRARLVVRREEPEDLFLREVGL